MGLPTYNTLFPNHSNLQSAMAKTKEKFEQSLRHRRVICNGPHEPRFFAGLLCPANEHNSSSTTNARNSCNPATRRLPLPHHKLDNGQNSAAPLSSDFVLLSWMPALRSGFALLATCLRPLALAFASVQSLRQSLLAWSFLVATKSPPPEPSFPLLFQTPAAQETPSRTTCTSSVEVSLQKDLPLEPAPSSSQFGVHEKIDPSASTYAAPLPIASLNPSTTPGSTGKCRCFGNQPPLLAPIVTSPTPKLHLPRMNSPVFFPKVEPLTAILCTMSSSMPQRGCYPKVGTNETSWGA